jgi:hypothetical protein
VILVELPEAVHGLEGDVEDAPGFLADPQALLDDRERLGPDGRPALPAAALTREISLSGRHVVIKPSRRRISASAFSSLGRITSSSSEGVV